MDGERSRSNSQPPIIMFFTGALAGVFGAIGTSVWGVMSGSVPAIVAFCTSHPREAIIATLFTMCLTGTVVSTACWLKTRRQAKALDDLKADLQGEKQKYDDLANNLTRTMSERDAASRGKVEAEQRAAIAEKRVEAAEAGLLSAMEDAVSEERRRVSEFKDIPYGAKFLIYSIAHNGELRVSLDEDGEFLGALDPRARAMLERETVSPEEVSYTLNDKARAFVEAHADLLSCVEGMFGDVFGAVAADRRATAVDWSRYSLFQLQFLSQWSDGSTGPFQYRASDGGYAILEDELVIRKAVAEWNDGKPASELFWQIQPDWRSIVVREKDAILREISRRWDKA